jgi:hypothetical protein
MSKPHQATAPTRLSGRGGDRDGVPHPRRDAQSALEAADATLDIRGQPGEAKRERDHAAGEGRRDDGESERRGPGKQAESQPDPPDDQGNHEHAVDEHQIRRHPPGHLASRHPRAAQGPGRERDPSDAGQGEQPGRGQAGHGDVIARAPVDAPAVICEHRPEQGDVGTEREDFQQHGDREPRGVATIDPLPGVREPGELRQEHVEAADRGRTEERASQQRAPPDWAAGGGPPFRFREGVA